MTSVTIDSIYAAAVVLTWPRGTFIYIDLTVQTSVAGFALTSVSVVMVHTGTTVLTGITLTLISFRFTVFPLPTRFTLTSEAVLLFNTLSMKTGPLSAVVHPREAQRAVSARRTQTLEPIHFVHTGASTHARV